MKVALIGSHGFIAGQLKEIWKKKYEVIGFARSPLPNEYFFDLNQINKVDFDLFDGIDIVLFLAADSSIESCQNNYETVKVVNVDATIYSIQRILDHKCRVVFFSSDAVYGNAGMSVYEDDECHPISRYGEMKQAVEETLKGVRFAKIVRLSYIFSYYDKFTKYYLSCVKGHITPQIYNPFSRSIMTILDLAGLIEWIIDKWPSMGIINACGNQLISRVELAKSIDGVLGIHVLKEIVDTPKNFTIYRPAVLDMRSQVIPNYLPELYLDSFFRKVSKEFDRAGVLFD